MSQSARPQQLNLGDWVQQLSRGDQLIAGSSIVLLIFMFINAWQHASVDCPGGNPLCSVASTSGASGFNGWGWLTFLALLAVIAFFVLRKFLADSVSLPALPVPDWQVYFGLGIVEVVSILLYWIEYRSSASFVGYSVSVGFGWAWVVALIAAAVTVVGGYLKQQDPQPVAGSTGGYTPPSPGGYAPPPPPPPPPPSGGGYGAPPPPSAPPPGG